MLQLLNLPLSSDVLAQYGNWQGVQEDCRHFGLDGIEAIWAGEDIPADLPEGLVQGYHLTFFPDWLDFYRWDTEALLLKYQNLEDVKHFYGGGPETLLKLYREDLDRAIGLGAKYVVFHVSDVSIEEGYTYRWLHSDEAVLDASAHIINALLDGIPPAFDFLLENQWWPGLTFTEPAKTRRLLDAISYPRTGLLLDTGHLMNCNPALRTQQEGLDYIHRMLDAHGTLADRVLGMHLHYSLSGQYVQENTGALPSHLPSEPIARFGHSYRHILQIDQHLPWTAPAVAKLIHRVRPRYLTHELAAGDRQARCQALTTQLTAIERGKIHGEP